MSKLVEIRILVRPSPHDEKCGRELDPRKTVAAVRAVLERSMTPEAEDKGEEAFYYDEAAKRYVTPHVVRIEAVETQAQA
jgi:hypothetical protein